MNTRELSKKTIMRAVLLVLQQGSAPSKKALLKRVAEWYSANPEDVAPLLDPAIFSLRVAGLIELSPTTNYITQAGQDFLKKTPHDISVETLSNIPEFNAYFLKL